MDELDEIVAWVRAHGPVPLPLDGWDQASIWGWDEATGSLYAHLWRNTDDPARPPTGTGSGPMTTRLPSRAPETLAQHIAMAAECSPWRALWVLLDVAGLNDEAHPPAGNEGDTAVTMTQGYSLPGWPYRAQPW